MRKSAFAYEQLTDELATQIRRGTLRAGDRIPSVRAMSTRCRLSVSTVLQAYRRLESLRLVEARPQSGFYVLPLRDGALPIPAVSSPRRLPTPVTTADLIGQMMQAVADPAAVPLGAALPDPALLPLTALKRCMVAAVRSEGPGGATQLSPEGSEALRVEIAKREWNGGRAEFHDEIIVTCGASEALDVALRATTEPGDVVAVESPAYFGVLQLIQALGRQALEVPTCSVDGLDLDELQAAIDAHPVRACVVTPSFQNPLGSRMPDPARKRLVTMLGPRGIPIIEDDTFAELPFDGARPRSLRVWDDWDQVLRCGSFGKTLAPGYRIGWIVPGPRHFNAVRQCRLATTIAASMPPQLALARYLASGGYDRHLRRLRKTLRDNVARLAAEVAARFPEGTRISRPAGGFVLWIELPEGLDALELFDGARRLGVSVCPGPVFSASGGYRNCIRLSAGHLWSEETEQAVQALAELLRAQLSGRQVLR